jgi:hypothetical protein
MLDRTLIAMSSDIDEDVDIVTGFVQSIEEDAGAVPRRWRITILEADEQHAVPVVSFTRSYFSAQNSFVLNAGQQDGTKRNRRNGRREFLW